MKLVHIIVRNEDANEVIDALVEDGFHITRLASTGGFLRVGSTVFISGIEDDQLDPMLKIVHAHTEVHVPDKRRNTCKQSGCSGARYGTITENLNTVDHVD